MMRSVKPFLVLIVVGMLSACAKSVYAPDADIAKRAYVGTDRPYLELWTMVNNKNGSGGHSSLVVNGGPQVIMYDPAGRWWSSAVPERNDVLFGLTPAVQKRYKSWHARDTHHVVTQRIYVSKEAAQSAYYAAIEQGASHDAMCAANVSALLDKVDGFAQLPNTFFPAGLMRKFGRLPGVVTEKYFEQDVGKN